MSLLTHKKTSITKAPKLPLRTYVFTWLGLLGLTLLTALIGFIDLGQFNIVISVAIAALQVSLIGGFFMHALYEKTLVRIIIGAAIIWFLIFETLTLGDYMTRGWVPLHFYPNRRAAVDVVPGQRPIFAALREQHLVKFALAGFEARR